MRVPGPVRIGWESVKTNATPMAVLWGLAIAAVGAYYLLDPFREMLEPVAEWHRAWGWKSAFVQIMAMISCSVNFAVASSVWI